VWTDVVRQAHPGAVLREPAPASRIADAGHRLGRALPDDLRGLLRESDGVLGHHLVDTVWSVDAIVERNLSMRTDAAFARLYQPFDGLLFFGDNGGGDHFAFAWEPALPGVVVWDHETDERRTAAPTLRAYLRYALRDGDDDWYR
jgi:hypothetical protein